MEWTKEQLKDVVEQVLLVLNGNGGVGGFHKEADPVRVKDVTTLAEAPRIAAGVMEVERTSFPWTLSYDEFDVVLSGTLEIKVGERTYTGRAGDIFYIPKGSSISFSSPDLARYVYVTYPADWNS